MALDARRCWSCLSAPGLFWNDQAWYLSNKGKFSPFRGELFFNSFDAEHFSSPGRGRAWTEPGHAGDIGDTGDIVLSSSCPAAADKPGGGCSEAAAFLGGSGGFKRRSLYLCWLCVKESQALGPQQSWPWGHSCSFGGLWGPGFWRCCFGAAGTPRARGHRGV